MTRRIAALLAGLFIAVAALAGCSQPAAVSYAPAAYGQNGQCFYDQDPSEATALLAAGLCPAGWVATPMPLYWHEEYYSYYSSPSYFNVYVPAARRTVYVTHETTFHTTYSSQITSASSKATYKGSNGKVVTGTTAKMKFSSGSGSTGKVGGGSLRSGTSGGSTGGSSGGTGSGGGKTTTTVKPKGGGGSVGGGSLRSKK
jgi:hypothetical protein